MVRRMFAAVPKLAGSLGARFALTWPRRRRWRRLAGFGADILGGRGEARDLTFNAWLSIGAFFALAAQAPTLGWLTAPSLVLYLALVAVSLFDARYFVILDELAAFLLALGAIVVCSVIPDDVLFRVGAAVGAYALLRIVALVYERLRGRPGLGQGDAKLFGVAGLWLGFEGLPSCLAVAVLSALTTVAVARRTGAAAAGADHAIPFGPHLALGLWLTWAFGPLEWR